MRTLRAYPYDLATVAKGNERRYIIDPTIEHFYHDNYDYTGLGAYDDDILLIEWDMAASRQDMERMETIARENPHEACVAPYLLDEPERENRPVWAHRRVWETDEEEGVIAGERWIDFKEPFAEYIGFGLVYLPRDLIRRFLDADPATRGTPYNVEMGKYHDTRFIDGTFSAWHFRNVEQFIYVAWQVLPIHLHW